jgi:hypothetical protein|nr:MAG TPA: hypothetical protein [Caudoviricetes sp.]
MKITMYELIGLIKDGKAPKKIKIHKTIYEWVFIHHEFCYADNSINRILLFEYYVRNNKLNDEIEIIEEDKKIEKLDLPCIAEFKRMSVAERYLVTAKEYDVLNELIDEVNKLKEGKL